MANLSLQNPSGKKWPDFFGEKSTRRKRIEENPAVQTLINCGFLLDVELNFLLYKILRFTNEINNLLPFDIAISEKDREPIISKTSEKLSQKFPQGSSKKPTDEDIAKFFNEAMEEFIQEKRKKRRESMVGFSNSIEDLLGAFKEKHRIPSLNILKPRVLYFCPKCKNLICVDEFQNKKCECGSIINTVSQTEHEYVQLIDHDVETFIRDNVWLECGVEKLFEELGYKTQCGVYILGSSGVKHEIDLIAEHSSEYKRVMAECKNTDIVLDDVFKLYGKMSDLGCNYGFIFSTSVSEGGSGITDVKRLASSKNIKILEGVLEISNEILKEKLVN